ncbi:MAG: radical SAM protein [Lachnospiraceae bacterium]|nr:radical SAM protein [Lachnospiraceae bacterium]
MSGRKLNLVTDLYGCPNRCRHCWLGHMPNRVMEPDADRFIVDFFDPYFEQIAFYSWLREPDFCEDYAARWERDLAVSKNARPERFELASFWRIVRDEKYIPFLKSVGVEKVQLTFFGLEETQDRYVGRKGAFAEVLKATELLIRGGIIPRWQCFLNEENIEEIVEVYRLYREIWRPRCPQMEFFVHEGSCDGENRKLYPIRIRKDHIPEELIPVYLDYNELLTERECCKMLRDDPSAPVFPVGGEITLNISNEYDVYYNYTEMSRPWVIGNLKKDEAGELVRRIVSGDTPALRRLKKVSWQALAERFGDASSERVFDPDDYRMFLVNRYLEEE